MSETNPFTQPQEGNPQPSIEQDLSTAVLSLPSPEYPGYQSTAGRDYAEPVVALLRQLKDSGVDRTDNPTLATYTGPRVNDKLLYEKDFESQIADAIARRAKEAGLRVLVRGTYGTYDGEPYVEKPTGFLALVGLIKRAKPQPVPEPDFRLRLSMDFDRRSERPDYRASTWSYKQLNHTITLATEAEVPSIKPY